MTGLRAAIATEQLKSRRSRVPWGVAAGFSVAPLAMGLFMISRIPGRAQPRVDRRQGAAHRGHRGLAASS